MLEGQITIIIVIVSHSFCEGILYEGRNKCYFLAVREIIEYCKKENIEVYLIVMDFEKSYDRIDRGTIEKAAQCHSKSELEEMFGMKSKHVK